MKKIIKERLLGGAVFGLSFFVIIFACLFLVKAWTSNYGGLESSPGDKLTVAKFNQLVARTSRIDVSMSETTAFNTNCERRWANPSMMYGTSITSDGSGLRYRASGTNTRRVVKNNDRTYMYLYDGGFTATKQSLTLLQKRCQ